MPSDSTQSDAYSQPNCCGVTEQLRLRNQYTAWPWTVAKRKTGFGTRYRLLEINRPL